MKQVKRDLVYSKYGVSFFWKDKMVRLIPGGRYAWKIDKTRVIRP